MRPAAIRIRASRSSSTPTAILPAARPSARFISANITPDADGLPAGLTLAEFRNVLRTGHDPDVPGRLLQVMPWPVYQSMSDRDIRAIYEYLRSIPHID